MKSKSFNPLIASALLLCYACQPVENHLEQRVPTPTDGRTVIHYGEEGEERDKRAAWLEQLHGSAPEVDWRTLEYQTQMQRHKRWEATPTQRSLCNGQTIENAYLKGHWEERGSSNQAGSVFDTEYDPVADEIWLISAGGTLWRGASDGSQWAVVNQDFQFNPGLLKFLPRDGGRRLVAIIGRIPHYSDDEGQTWTAATGITHQDRWGTVYCPVVVEDAFHSIYVLAKPSYWADIKLYRSVDQGETYLPVGTFNTYETNRLRLCSPHHSDELWLAEKASDEKAKLYRTNPATGQLQLMNSTSSFNFSTVPANLIGWKDENGLSLYAYTTGQVLHRSTDNGNTWTSIGTLPATPWEVGLYMHPENPSVLFMGEVDCYRSLNGGQSWIKVNNWWEYYDDVAGKLHADMMHFKVFKKQNGQPFLLVSHHGGLTISYNNLQSMQNISLLDLNVSQYYSVRTDPLQPQYVYAGSQDQGFQIADQFDQPGAVAFDQVISGDYGHIVFSNNGQSLWTVYPGGWATFYEYPSSGSIQASFNLDSSEESVWLPPLMGSPFPNDKAAYMAGGNINGGSGSYIIRMEPQGGQVFTSQLNFNFSLESGGGQVSALATAVNDPDTWYAATTNGRFFHSVDQGSSWSQSINFLPEGHYLYGQAIYPYKNTPHKVLLAGSGYSNPPVYVSVNDGESFFAMSNGLPPTLVFELAGNADDSRIFAATEAGPFVYIAEQGEWMDLTAACAPVQTYWSVEFLEEQNIARFGTYGRGIWDFVLDEPNVTKPSPLPLSLKVFPNPAREELQLQAPSSGWRLQLLDKTGRMVYQESNIQDTWRWNCAHLPRGLYLLRLEKQGQVLVHKIVLM
ncbi:MAG TPA: T9SS type A sorting domain-containing protein [Saprospiraceae bacterium]|nr:T9SS type A sorting domain-containing protein [Saprospiraceae bacterium]HMQ83837.1 T9SS type A sorting domain-containing protein [Saprospiraceae bacterium]